MYVFIYLPLINQVNLIEIAYLFVEDVDFFTALTFDLSASGMQMHFQHVLLPR